MAEEFDQQVYDDLIAQGKSERVAKAKAKAAYVRREKARLRQQRGDAAGGGDGGDPDEETGS